MYVHLGQDTVILTKDIIGIFDLDNTTVSKITREMLRTTEQNGETKTVGMEIPKSFVVCSNAEKKNTVWICMFNHVYSTPNALNTASSALVYGTI